MQMLMLVTTGSEHQSIAVHKTGYSAECNGPREMRLFGAVSDCVNIDSLLAFAGGLFVVQ